MDCLRKNQRKQVNIKRLTSVEMAKFLRSFDYVISDIDGILFNHKGVHPYGLLLINGLKEMGKEYFFVTSNTQKSHFQLMDELQAVGLTDVKHRHILSPAKTLLHYLKEDNSQLPIYSICNEHINDYLARNSIKVIKPEGKLDLTLHNIEKRLKTYCPVQAVVLDYSPNTSWCNYALANRYLNKNPKAKIICLKNEVLTEVEPEFPSIGSISFLHVIGHNTCNPSIPLFKPNLFIGQDIINYFKILMPTTVLYIGTSIESEIKMANLMKFQTLLLKTPDLKWTNYLALPKSHQPDYVADSLSDLLCCFDIDYDNNIFQ